MPFQFLCPRGHLLEGEEHEQGQAAQCPHCGSLFVIPAPPDRAAFASAQGSPASGWSGAGDACDTPDHGGWKPPQTEPSPRWAEQSPQLAQANAAPSAAPAIDPPGGAARVESLEFYHIACPNGHELETPRDMLGQEAMCPFCGARFALRMEDSREFRQQKATEEAHRQQRIGKFWLQWSIAAAVVVALALVVLIVLAASR